jgi:prephenate dehydrogenase
MNRVGVLGLGQIGGSIGKNLVRAGLAVAGYDPDPETRAMAADAGIAVHSSVGDWLRAQDLVVVAAPIDQLAASFAEVRAWLVPGQTVIDVASVKGEVHEIARSAGLGGSFVGCHPMAGKAEVGFEVSDADLLNGISWAVTADDTTPAPATRAVIRFLMRHFSARISVLDPATHDQAVATISHTPHVLASALLASLGSVDSPRAAAVLAAGSFRDGTRVAGTGTHRTANMVVHNAASVAGDLDALIKSLAELRGYLGGADKGADPVAIEQWFDASREVRETYLGSGHEAVRLPLDCDVASLVGHGKAGWLVVAVDGKELVLERGGANRAFAAPVSG